MNSGQPCSPMVGIGDYPHDLELSCWEHGSIARLGYTASADSIARLVAEHHAKVAA